jgi:hypothetical protein
MNVFSLQPYEVNEIEPCFIVQKHTNKVFIPKVMPLLSNGSTNKNTESISPNLINASDCLPSYSRRVTSQNYITAIGQNRLYERGTRLLSFVVNKNLRHIILSDYIC